MSAPTTEAIPQVKSPTPNELLAMHLIAFGGQKIGKVGDLIAPTDMETLTSLNRCACCHADDHPRNQEPDDKFLRGGVKGPIIPQPFSLN
jgi:hypothetical protein